MNGLTFKLMAEYRFKQLVLQQKMEQIHLWLEARFSERRTKKRRSKK
jgi:hypothetical protein